MRRIVVAAAVALAAFSGVALADGPIVRWDRVEWVNTPPVSGKPGSIVYQGFVDLPAACRDYPEELVFLIRHTETPPFFGAFVLYGAERSFR